MFFIEEILNGLVNFLFNYWINTNYCFIFKETRERMKINNFIFEYQPMNELTEVYLEREIPKIITNKE